MNGKKIVFVILVIAFAFPLLAYNVSGQGSTGTGEFPIDFVSLGIGGAAGLAGGLLFGWFIGKAKSKGIERALSYQSEHSGDSGPLQNSKDKKKDKDKEATENKKEFVGHVSLMK